MSLINKMLNELEKNKKSDPKHFTALSGIIPTIKKQKGIFRWKLTLGFMALAMIVGILWSQHQKITTNLSKATTSIKTKVALKKPEINKSKNLPATKPKIKLQNIVLEQQENQTILDFVLSAPTEYYIEQELDKQKLLITLNNTGLLGNLPVALEDSFLMALDNKQHENDTTITLSLLPGTKIDKVDLIIKPKPHLRLVFSNPQLVTNSGMSKTPVPLSPEQEEIEQLEEIQKLLAQDKIQSATHKLYILIGDFPDNLQARAMLASLLIKNGRIKKANEFLMIGLNKYQNHIPFIKLKAHILVKQNKSMDAIDLLEEHAATTNDIELLAILAAIYQQQGYFMLAAKIYNQLTKVQPQEVKWWFGLGIALENAKKRNAAKEAYRRAYNTPNTSPELRRLLNDKLKNRS